MTTPEKTLREIIEGLLEMAKSNLMEYGNVAPMLMTFGGKPIVASIGLVDKALFPAIARKVVQESNATMIVHINEAWMAVVDPRVDDLRRRPADRENRKEVIVVEGKSALGEKVTVLQEFDRDAAGKPIVTAAPQWMPVGGFSRVLDACFRDSVGAKFAS